MQRRICFSIVALLVLISVGFGKSGVTREEAEAKAKDLEQGKIIKDFIDSGFGILGAETSWYGNIVSITVQGKRLLPETDYTLIYYPDEWPGKGLICLGSNMSNPNGNLQIAGNLEILSGLPAPYDKNFNPVPPSGAVGAKIWLVPAADVKCEGTGEIDPETGFQADPPQLLGWNPASYLFEANMIVYQYAAPVIDPEIDDDDDSLNCCSPMAASWQQSGAMERVPAHLLTGLIRSKAICRNFSHCLPVETQVMQACLGMRICFGSAIIPLTNSGQAFI